MAPLPVISNVKRITVNFTPYGGVTPRCVFHLRGDMADEEELGLAIWDSATEHLYGPMHDGFEPGSLDILPLDGSSATFVSDRPVGDTTSWCSSSGDTLPSTAAIVSFRTGIRGPKGRGRQYVGPTTETSCANGILNETVRTNLIASWAGFNNNLLALPDSMQIVVASYVHAEAYAVTSIGVPQTVGTQRRRQRQLQ